MKVSRRTDYALRALFTLVEFHGGQPVPIRELARRNDIPKKFLEQIMLELKAKQWVESVSGINGGYRLHRHPTKITMGEIVRHFEGMLAPLPCVSVKGYERCTQERVCRFRRVFLEARNYVARLLDHSTLHAVYQGSEIVTDDEVGSDWFGDGI